MRAKLIADMLDGREYTDEITPDIQNELDNSNCVVVYGGSDDIMEFRGAFNDEISCFDGGTAYVTKTGLVVNMCDDYDCPYFHKAKSKATVIEALWCKEPDLSWTYKTDIPHITFTIMEDGEKYCRGIVFRLSDIPTTKDE